jgi:hypothetical protein
MTYRSLLCLSAALMLLVPTVVRADEKKEVDPISPDRPGIADGSGVIGPGFFQIESGVQQEFQGSERRLFVPTLFRIGFSDKWEGRIESNTFSDVHDPGFHTSGYSPISAGFKYQFMQPSDKNGQLSMGTIVRVFPPSGSGDFHTHHVTGDARLTADWQFSKNWSLNPNVGVGMYESSRGHNFATGLGALTLTYGPNNRLQPFIDTALQAPEDRPGKTAVFLDGGVTYRVARDTQFDLAVGTGLAGDTAAFFWTAGVSHRFR